MNRLLEYAQRHPVLVGLLLVAVVAVLAFELRSRRYNYASIRPQEAVLLMKEGAQVYDLRPAEAYAAGHISGARHLAPAQHDSAAELLKKYREKLLVLYCDDGSLSSAMTRRLHAAGFTKVFNLRNGLGPWRADGMPLQRG